MLSKVLSLPNGSGPSGMYPLPTLPKRSPSLMYWLSKLGLSLKTMYLAHLWRNILDRL